MLCCNWDNPPWGPKNCHQNCVICKRKSSNRGRWTEGRRLKTDEISRNTCRGSSTVSMRKNNNSNRTSQQKCSLGRGCVAVKKKKGTVYRPLKKTLVHYVQVKIRQNSIAHEETIARRCRRGWRKKKIVKERILSFFCTCALLVYVLRGTIVNRTKYCQST